MTRQASIVVPGASTDDALNIFEILVKPGATVRETLILLGLSRYVLRNGSGHPFLESDILYSQIEDGTQLYATPLMDVG
jgi:hypothetical protein